VKLPRHLPPHIREADCFECDAPATPMIGMTTWKSYSEKDSWQLGWLAVGELVVRIVIHHNYIG
jgi:hypothetical protein